MFKYVSLALWANECDSGVPVAFADAACLRLSSSLRQWPWFTPCLCWRFVTNIAYNQLPCIFQCIFSAFYFMLCSFPEDLGSMIKEKSAQCNVQQQQRIEQSFTPIFTTIYQPVKVRSFIFSFENDSIFIIFSQNTILLKCWKLLYSRSADYCVWNDVPEFYLFLSTFCTRKFSPKKRKCYLTSPSGELCDWIFREDGKNFEGQTRYLLPAGQRARLASAIRLQAAPDWRKVRNFQGCGQSRGSLCRARQLVTGTLKETGR